MNTIISSDERTKERALKIITAAPGQFRPKFYNWLMENWDLYKHFEREAISAADYRDHYSAHTIVEYMRHETMLREKGASEYKLNEAWSSSLARMFAHLNPRYEKLFEFRVREGGIVAAFSPISSSKEISHDAEAL